MDDHYESVGSKAGLMQEFSRKLDSAWSTQVLSPSSEKHVERPSATILRVTRAGAGGPLFRILQTRVS